MDGFWMSSMMVKLQVWTETVRSCSNLWKLHSFFYGASNFIFFHIV